MNLNLLASIPLAAAVIASSDGKLPSLSEPAKSAPACCACACAESKAAADATKIEPQLFAGLEPGLTVTGLQDSGARRKQQRPREIGLTGGSLGSAQLAPATLSGAARGLSSEDEWRAIFPLRPGAR